MKPRLAAAAALALIGGQALAIDVAAMWDFSKPDVSEQRFRDALAAASPDEALILQTQIARTWGLRKDFAKAQAVLAGIAPAIPSASPEAQLRYWLEYGRTLASPAHTKEQMTPQAREQAREAYMKAFDIAKASRQDYLAIDVLHMLVMVDPAPDDQLKWNEKAIAYMEASDQPEAKKWAGSLYNNVGYAHHLAGRYDEALANYRKSLDAHEKANRPVAVRIAHWMIAHTYRAQKRWQEAIDIQLRLEREWEAAGAPDPYVYEELEHLYKATGNAERAAHYGAKLKAAQGA